MCVGVCIIKVCLPMDEAHCWMWPLTSRNSRKDVVWSSVSEVTEEIRKFSFRSALNELYFAVWASPVVQSSSPVPTPWEMYPVVASFIRLRSMVEAQMLCDYGNHQAVKTTTLYLHIVESSCSAAGENTFGTKDQNWLCIPYSIGYSGYGLR